MARILVVDDDELMRATIAALLTHNRHTVVEAQGAREAVDMHRCNPVDLIVTDLLMKEMDGTELLRRVWAFSPQTPIIAISGAVQGKIYLNMARLLGADRILAKPFQNEAFMDAVEGVLGSPKIFQT
jgi:CheY-like chemotaxis protein